MRLRKLCLVVLALFVLALAVNVGFAQSEECDMSVDYAAEAESALEADDLDAAFAAYDCALESDAFDYDLRMDRMDSAILAGDYMTAYSDVFLLNNVAAEVVLVELEDLRDMDDYIKLRAFLAIFAVLPDYELALSDVESMLEDDPESAFAYVIRAAAYEGMEDFESAQAAFAQALELSPDNAQIYGLMAAAEFTIFNIPAIKENATIAIELDPTIPQLYRLRGFTSMVMGDPAAAIEDGNAAIELDPDYFAYYILRGNALLATGDPEGALADFNKVIELIPDAGFGYALRAQLYAATGDMPAAAADMATTIEFRTLEEVDGDMLVMGEATMVTMTFGRVIYLPFDAEEGTMLTLSATSVNPGEVDPIILLLAPDDTPITFNDDADPMGESLDSAIAEFPIAESGTYTLVVSHANAGSEGDLEVLVEQN